MAAARALEEAEAAARAERERAEAAAREEAERLQREREAAEAERSARRAALLRAQQADKERAAAAAQRLKEQQDRMRAAAAALQAHLAEQGSGAHATVGRVRPAWNKYPQPRVERSGKRLSLFHRALADTRPASVAHPREHEVSYSPRCRGQAELAPSLRRARCALMLDAY